MRRRILFDRKGMHFLREIMDKMCRILRRY